MSRGKELEKSSATEHQLIKAKSDLNRHILTWRERVYDEYGLDSYANHKYFVYGEPDLFANYLNALLSESDVQFLIETEIEVLKEYFSS